MHHFIIHAPDYRTHVVPIKSYIINTKIIADTYLRKIETKARLENRLHKNVRQPIKDRIDERLTKRIKHHRRNKNLTTHHMWNDNKITNKRPHIYYGPKINEIEEFTNSTDHKTMWKRTIDKWTRNSNFHREMLTDSLLSNSTQGKKTKTINKFRIKRINKSKRKRFSNRTTGYFHRILRL